jgi:hypothetical protein
LTSVLEPCSFFWVFTWVVGALTWVLVFCTCRRRETDRQAEGLGTCWQLTDQQQVHWSLEGRLCVAWGQLPRKHAE